MAFRLVAFRLVLRLDFRLLISRWFLVGMKGLATKRFHFN